MNLCKVIILVLAAAFLALAASAQEASADDKTGALTVVITGFKHAEGFAMVALADTEECYDRINKNPFRKDKATIDKTTARVVFNDLPFGEYAVAMYHDENGNGELETNLVGMPKEPYGFSNNASGKFGKPDWDKVKFTLDADKKQIQINLK